ncbi:MAG: Hsp20/alpha crystallin family protein, partial [Spirochaetes bacterium]|nr:Hsp20/alpha crystallin family protein [Spirochaetota bacterium]
GLDQEGYEGNVYPSINVYEHDDLVELMVLLPGLDEKDIEAKIEDGILSISGKKKIDYNKEGKVLRQERFFGEFERNVKINTPVDNESINALYEKGVLSITVKKSEEAKPKKIEIS